MTCDNCIHYDVCEALEMNGIAKVHPIQCGYFNDKSRYIELPCKVGDTVYVITEKHPCYACMCVGDFCHKYCTVKDKSKLVVKEAKVFYFLFSERSNEFRVEIEQSRDLVMHFVHFGIKDFGKTVFLTREQAEKALAERSATDERKDK